MHSRQSNTVLPISIHVLREEDDTSMMTEMSRKRYFYPRPPRGGRLSNSVNCLTAITFLSTSSARRTTLDMSSCSPTPSRLFLSTSSARRTTRESGVRNSMDVFLSTSSARRTTMDSFAGFGKWMIFLSTSSARRTTTVDYAKMSYNIFLSTSSARRTTQMQADLDVDVIFISIHVLREEDDRQGRPLRSSQVYFYPRPPRGGRPGAARPRCPGQDISIHVLREEDDYSLCSLPTGSEISIHVLREEDDGCILSPSTRQTVISIHVLREEDDLYRINRGSYTIQFLSTSSARRTTRKSVVAAADVDISIHVLREEDDRRRNSRRNRGYHFYPRPPRGGRPHRSTPAPSFR